MAKKHNAPEKPALEPKEALFQAVSLCRKAGALTMGFDAVEEAVVKGKAWLVMTASDASAKTVQRLNYAVGDSHLRRRVKIVERLIQEKNLRIDDHRSDNSNKN